MNAPTVLVLDDDANTLLALGAVLERTNARVIGCENEDCVMNWCSEQSTCIDVMIADVVLPKSNGPDVVRRVKPLRPMMRLLFISGFSLSELRRRGLMNENDLIPGKVEFLQKPFSPEAFLQRVNTLLAP
jgi:response regulator RpfG family c-di-GMP phosphodiesterase